ncbi:MAG: hypothetical protein QME68_06530, partial [Elusimicrobiota bacterium]|nr:hypothetical protein [Elusimicrobiota bacterium]
MSEFQRKKFIFERIAGKINLHPLELTIGMALAFWLIMYIFFQVANLPFTWLYLENELVWFTYWGLMALWLKFFADSFVETIKTLNLDKKAKQELIEDYPPYNTARYLLVF